MGTTGMTTTRLSLSPVIFVESRGIEGGGQRHTLSLFPGVLDDDRGAGFLPAASSTGAGVKPTRRSLLNSFAPH